ncbi:phosphoesterase, partial [candidate division KSB3 bacterium]
MIPEIIVQEIQTATNVALFTHTNPDGDALGSLFGLASILESTGKRVFCYLDEPVSHIYDFLPDIELGNIGIDAYRSFVDSCDGKLVAVALDCGDDARLGENRHEFLETSPFIVIDHHRGHRDFGTCRWVDPARSSTGEMVYELAQALDAEIPYNGAYNLYVAICTDTGSFRYENTTGRTMQIAGELIEKGVKTEEVGQKLYDNYSPERLRLLQMALQTIEIEENEQIAFMTVTQQMLAESGAVMADVDGFIDFARSLKTVKVAAIFKET